MRKLILSALLLASAFKTALGQTTEGEWTYIVENSGATITRSTATGAVTIPSELNGIPVVRIGTVWAPEFIRSDNGSEFIAKELQGWLAKEKIKTIYTEPGSPWQNGFVESFHGRFRDECLNREQLWTLTEARVVIEDFRIQYNTQRPHSKLGYRSPADYVAQLPRSPVPVGLGLPTPEIDKPRLMLQPQINAQTNSPGGSKR